MSRTPLCGEFVCRQPRRSGVRHLVEGTQQRPDLPLGVVALVARDLGAASSVPVREHALDEVVEHVIERVGRRVACGILAALSAGNRDLTFIGDSLPTGVDSVLPACASSRSSVSQPPSPDADPGRTSASTSQGRGVSATCPMTASGARAAVTPRVGSRSSSKSSYKGQRSLANWSPRGLWTLGKGASPLHVEKCRSKREPHGDRAAPSRGGHGQHGARVPSATVSSNRAMLGERAP
jgi:hypothetical protein